MDEDRMERVVRNIDARLERVEQVLPALATRDELRAVIAPLATRDEMHAAIQAAVAPLATREELQAAVEGLSIAIKEEGARSRQYTDIRIEDLRDDNRLILEHLIALSARVDALCATGRVAVGPDFTRERIVDGDSQRPSGCGRTISMALPSTSVA